VVKIKPKYITKISQLKHLSDDEKAQLEKVAAKFAFKTNDYYLSLIDWNDPNDPIRRIIIPDVQELQKWGRPDPSDEKAYTIMPGLEHKYTSTVLMLVNNTCDGICRYCFRKRIFEKSKDESIKNIDKAIEYIDSHQEVTNVLLTGGDPLMSSTQSLEYIISRLREIDHIEIIRLGTKIPVFNPYKIIEDKSLLKMIEKYSLPKKKIYIMTHFSHPRELTEPAAKAVSALQKAGAILTNQCPLIRGVNDNSDVLAELLRKASFCGVTPYYIFQCRPALGNRAYSVPIEESIKIVKQARGQVSGLAKRAKYVMSHSSGKIEIIGKKKDTVYFKYHRAFRDQDSGRILVFKSNPQAYWLDDYPETARKDIIGISNRDEDSQ